MFKQPWDQEYTSTDCLDNHQKTTHQDTRLIEAYRVERANREKAETLIKSLEQEVELIRRQIPQKNKPTHSLSNKNCIYICCGLLNKY